VIIGASGNLYDTTQGGAGAGTVSLPRAISEANLIPGAVTGVVRNVSAKGPAAGDGYGPQLGRARLHQRLVHRGLPTARTGRAGFYRRDTRGPAKCGSGSGPDAADQPRNPRTAIMIEGGDRVAVRWQLTTPDLLSSRSWRSIGARRAASLRIGASLPGHYGPEARRPAIQCPGRLTPRRGAASAAVSRSAARRQAMRRTAHRIKSAAPRPIMGPSAMAAFATNHDWVTSMCIRCSLSVPKGQNMRPPSGSRPIAAPAVPASNGPGIRTRERAWPERLS
jgi:hypothetical protein